MVLYYGLLALETANNTVASAAAAATTTTTSDRSNLSRKEKYSSSSIGKMASSSNSWIYTEDLRKRFEERYADYHYVFVPVYIDKKSTRRNHSTTGSLSQKIDQENSWMYSRSLRDHLFYSSSKISLPITTNISSSTCCVTNHGFMRDELPIKKDLKTRFFKRSSSAKEKSVTNLSSSSLPFSPFTSSTSSFSTTNNLVKHRTSDVVEEEDDEEGVDDENHSAPLIKQDSGIPTALSRTIAVSATDNNIIGNSTDNNELESSTMKHVTTHNNKLTRLRSFFFKSSSPSSSRTRQQQTSLSSSLLSNRISKT